MELLNLKNVSKSYHNHQALEDISVSIPKGSIYGLLGPNGAGKSTLIRIITTILHADHGSISFNGAQLQNSHTRNIGYLPEQRGLYIKMTVKENILFFAQLKHLKVQTAEHHMNDYLKEFDLYAWKDEKVENLSKGMQQKVQFILTVLHQPDLLILDEPFSGLDPINTNLLRDKVRELQNNGTTIIFSTHRMEQVESLCTQICLINNGKKLIEGEVSDLKHQFKPNQLRITFASDIPNSFSQTFEIIEQLSSKECIIQLSESFSRQDVLTWLSQNNTDVSHFSEVLPSLDTIFMEQVHNA